MEVNEAFFMSTNYPHKYNIKDSATIPRKWEKEKENQPFWRFSVLYLLKKLPLISKIAELDPTNNAEDLFLPGSMSN